MVTFKKNTLILIVTGLLLCCAGLSQADTLLSDDFSTNAAGWRVADTADELLEFRNGYYFYSQYRTSGTFQTTQEIFVNQAYDFEVETSIIKREGDDNDAFFGLTWAASDFNSYFNFAVNGFGMFTVYQVTDGVQTTFAPKTASTFLIQGEGRTNKLTLKKSGYLLEFYINDHLVFDMPGQTLPGDNIGCFITGYQEIALNNFTVEGSVGAGCAAAPGPVTLTGPTGTITDTTPTITWNTVSCATWYRLFVWDSDEEKVHTVWYEASDVCSGGSCAVTLDALYSDTYEYWVKSWNDYGKVWSDGASFTIQGNDEPAPLPGKAAIVSPSGTSDDTTPSVEWTKGLDATWYQLLIWNSAGQPVLKQWNESSAICSGNRCTTTLTSGLADDQYDFWIKSWNDNGYVWSDGGSFTVSTGSDPGGDPGGDSELDQEIEFFMDIVTSVGDLSPMVEEISTILTEVLNGDSSVVSITPAGVLDDLLGFLSAPQPVTISANFGSGYTPPGGTGTLTGSMVIHATNIGLSATGITADIDITATNVKRDGVLVLDGGLDMSVVLRPGANEVISLTGSADFSNLRSLDFQVNGGITISAPSVVAGDDGQMVLNQPVTITFQNLTTIDYQVSGTATLTQNNSAYDMVLNLTTNQGNVTGKVRLDMSNPDRMLITTPSGPLQIEEYTVSFNNVAFEPEGNCPDTPTSGNIVITGNSETKTITFSPCDYAVN